MHRYLSVLIMVLVCLLATVSGLLAGACESSSENLLLLDDVLSTVDALNVGQDVWLEGVVKVIHSQRHFIIQVQSFCKPICMPSASDECAGAACPFKTPHVQHVKGRVYFCVC